MATQNLSAYDKDKIPSAEKMRFAIIVSRWNSNVTFALRDGAYNTLLKHGALKENITVNYVPGSFELVYGAKLYTDREDCDAVIVLGSVIQGETPHFDYVCQGVTQGVAQLNALKDTPVIFGLLTTDNYRQAEERAGGKRGNKGDEAAVTAINMLEFKKKAQL